MSPTLIPHQQTGDLWLSPSSIRNYEECIAGYLYRKVVLPRITTEDAKKIVEGGAHFHDIAEVNFDKEQLAVILSTLDHDEVKKNDIISWAAIIEARDYYKLPNAVNEAELIYEFGPGRTIRGFVDRLIMPDKKHVKIVDYKTSWQATPWKDVRQVMIYAYIVWKTSKVKPENIELILDYPNAGECHEIQVTESKLIAIGNYLAQIFRRIEGSLDSFYDNKPMRSFDHMPGDGCSFCPVRGNCAAYEVYFNPAYPMDDLDTMEIIDQIKEYQLRSQVVKINDERVKVLKRSLLAHWKKGQEHMAEEEEVKDAETIKESCSVIAARRTLVKREPYLKKMIPKLINSVLKSNPMKGEVDTQLLERKMTDLFRTIYPEMMEKGQTNSDIVTDNPDMVITTKRDPYIKLK